LAGFGRDAEVCDATEDGICNADDDKIKKIRRMKTKLKEKKFKIQIPKAENQNSSGSNSYLTFKF